MVAKKCKSRTFPCPSGDRCPDHRGQEQAVFNALKGSGLEAAQLLVKENLEQEEKKQLNEFLSKVRVKTLRNGSTKVVMPGDKKTVYEKTTLTSTSKVTVSKPSVTVIPRLDPATAVDKTIAVRSGNDYKNGFQNRLNDLYDNNVTIHTGKRNMAGHVITSISLGEGYKNKGIEAHVLASYVVDNRPDLYDFYGSSLEIPYSEYEKAGFEPNPYYWAGQTHPETGVTYPTVEELDSSWEEDTKDNEAYMLYSLYNLRNLKHMDAKEQPYVRMMHGWTFKDIPLSSPFSKEEYKKVRAKWSAKQERELRSRSAVNPLDIH